MRILLVGDYPADARLGSTKVVVKLQEEFRGLGHTCDVVLGDDLGASPRNRQLRQAFCPMMALAAVRRMFRVNGRYDVVDVASAEGLWVGALRRLILRGTAVVSRSNGLEHTHYQNTLADHDAGLVRKPWTRRLFYPAVRLTQVAGAARAADRLILLNEIDRAFAIGRGWKRDVDIDVVPHGVSARFLADAPPPQQPRGGGILFCGTWIELKGITYLAAAFSKLVAAGTTATLTVLGGGVPAAAIMAGFSCDARRLVRVVDRSPEEAVMLAYRSHDVLTLPSTYEGFGMVVIEAMSQRLPVVATPVGCASTMIVPERTGLLVPARDPSALATALDRMLHDKALGARCAAAAFDRVRDMTWTNTARRTLAVYERALEANRNGH